jgi:uncharacterized membrane protein YphA (DoxX/SURF4 family)
MLYALRLFLSATTLWAGLEKARNPKLFTHSVNAYAVVPIRWGGPVALGVTAAELAFGGLLLFDRATTAAALGLLVTFAVFTGAIAINLVRGNNVACHCFGANSNEKISWAALARALLLLVATTAVALLSRQPQVALPTPALLPLITIAGSLTLVTRLMGLLPQTWSYLMSPVRVPPSHRRRVSLRSAPMDGSFKVVRVDANGGSKIPSTLVGIISDGGEHG